jgi:hypothetical protein
VRIDTTNNDTRTAAAGGLAHRQKGVHTSTTTAAGLLDTYKAYGLFDLQVGRFGLGLADRRSTAATGDRTLPPRPQKRLRSLLQVGCKGPVTRGRLAAKDSGVFESNLGETVNDQHRHAVLDLQLLVHLLSFINIKASPTVGQLVGDDVAESLEGIARSDAPLVVCLNFLDVDNGALDSPRLNGLKDKEPQASMRHMPKAMRLALVKVVHNIAGIRKNVDGSTSWREL